MQITEHFNLTEFEESEVAQQQGINNKITDCEICSAIFSLVREVLEPLRQLYGKPMHVNSGYRCPALNKAVGGVATSQHTKGEAADIKTGSSAESRRLAVLLKSSKLPFDQIGLYGTFVHISHKANGRQRGSVFYDKSYKGKAL